MFFKNAPREQSFWFEGSDWKMILTAFLHLPLFFFSTCYHHYVFFTPPALPKKHHRGHRVTTGMRWLICPTQHWQQCLCLLHLCEAESQHANVYLRSGGDPVPPSFYQTAVLCLFAISEAFMVTTHTGGQRGEAASLPLEKDELDLHTTEKETRRQVWCITTLYRGFKLKLRELILIEFNSVFVRIIF